MSHRITGYTDDVRSCETQNTLLLDQLQAIERSEDLLLIPDSTHGQR